MKSWEELIGDGGDDVDSDGDDVGDDSTEIDNTESDNVGDDNDDGITKRSNRDVLYIKRRRRRRSYREDYISSLTYLFSLINVAFYCLNFRYKSLINLIVILELFILS